MKFSLEKLFKNKEGIKEEKKDSRNSFIENTKKAGLFLSPAFLAFLASCNGPETPTQLDIKNYFEKTADAEKIDSAGLKIANEHIANFVDYMNTTKKEVSDMRDPNLVNQYHEEYPDYVYVDEWKLVNDSTVVHTAIDPKIQKYSKEHQEKYGGIMTMAHETMYITHSDGGIEIGKGNLVESDRDFLEYVAIDGETGGITRYSKEPFTSNSFHLSNNQGATQTVVGNDYTKGNAQSFAEIELKSLENLKHIVDVK